MLPRIGPPEQIGPFAVEAELGRGGMGVVYLATQAGLDRKVALKVLSAEYANDPEFVERFHREATNLARVDSPHVVAIYDHGQYDGTLCLATQYVSGGDLSHYLAEHGPMPAELALDVLAQLAEALRDAHNLGIVHRDVKPGNILLRGDRSEPYVYLCDFGIAQSGNDSRTRTGVVAGSLAYMAPERHLGQPATAQSDLYSLGCVLWTMLSGHTPYIGTDFQQATGHMKEPTPQVSGQLPNANILNHILAWTMAKDPAARPKDAKELIAFLSTARGDLAAADGHTRLRAAASDTRLRAAASDTRLRDAPGGATVLAQQPPSAYPFVPPPPPLPPQPPPRRRGALIPIVAAAALLLVGATAWVVLAVSAKDDKASTTAPPPTTATQAPTTTAAQTPGPGPAEPTEPAEPPQPDPVIVDEDFSSGSMPAGWRPVVGSWKIVNGHLEGKGGSGRARIAFGPMTPTNYRLEVDARFVAAKDATRWLNIGLDYHPGSATANNDFGAVLVLRKNTAQQLKTNNNSKCGLTGGVNTTGGVELAQNEGSQWCSWPTDSASSAMGADTARITVEVSDNRLVSATIRFADGSEQTFFEDANLYRSGGQFGFVINDATVQFDNVLITSLD